MGAAEAFWMRALTELPEDLALPTDRVRPEVASHRVGSVAVMVDAGLRDQLLALGRETDATLVMVLQAVLAALLTRLGAGTDIPIGTPVAASSDDPARHRAGMPAPMIAL